MSLAPWVQCLQTELRRPELILVGRILQKLPGLVVGRLLLRAAPVESEVAERVFFAERSAIEEDQLRVNALARGPGYPRTIHTSPRDFQVMGNAGIPELRHKMYIPAGCAACDNTG